MHKYIYIYICMFALAHQILGTWSRKTVQNPTRIINLWKSPRLGPPLGNRSTAAFGKLRKGLGGWARMSMSGSPMAEWADCKSLPVPAPLLRNHHAGPPTYISRSVLILRGLLFVQPTYLANRRCIMMDIVPLNVRNSCIHSTM